MQESRNPTTKHKRQKEIEQYGYQGYGIRSNTDEENEEDEAEEDALNEIFMMGTKQHRRRLRNGRGYNSGGGGTAKDNESYKRF